MERLFGVIDKYDKILNVSTDLGYCIKHSDNQPAIVELTNDLKIMRYIATNADCCYEGCSECGGESVLKAEFRVQHCTECGEEILPCNLCNCDYCDCNKCPLRGENGKYLGGINPIVYLVNHFD